MRRLAAVNERKSPKPAAQPFEGLYETSIATAVVVDDEGRILQFSLATYLLAWHYFLSPVFKNPP
jgi:hypothetical protein